MELDEEREGPEDLEENGMGEDDTEEEDLEADTPINLFISCEQVDAKSPCTNLGKCMTFDQATGLFVACEHLLITEDEDPNMEWEEN